MSKTYITTLGDMWDLIALREMGNEINRDRLMQANIEHRHVYVFSAGVELIIPDVPARPPDGLPPWKR